MPKLIDRLEQALKVWEDMMFATACAGEARIQLEGGSTRLFGAFKYWKELRDYLIRFRGEQFDVERFCLGRGPEGGAFDSFPCSLAAWTAFSRVAYHLTPQLQVCLELTPLDNLYWKDVPWPFTAFAILLDRPLPTAHGDMCDILLVSRRAYYWETGDRQLVEFRMIPRAVGMAPRLDRHEARRWVKLQQRGRWDELYEVSHEFAERLSHADIEQEVGVYSCHPDLPITEVMEGASRRYGVGSDYTEIETIDLSTSPMGMAIRVAVGLSLYLSMLPPKSPHLQYEQEEGSRDQVKPITSGADVCKVLSNFRLSDEAIESLGGESALRPFHEVKPHWRRGHFRRPPGQGKNPHAKRTIWIHPYYVRRDRLADDAQVGGSHVDVE